MAKNPNPSKFSSNLDASVFYLPSPAMLPYRTERLLLGQIPEFFLLLAGEASSPLSSPTSSRMEDAGNMQWMPDNWGPFKGSAMTSATPGHGCLDWA
jgi:hypothetical protein